MVILETSTVYTAGQLIGDDITKESHIGQLQHPADDGPYNKQKPTKDNNQYDGNDTEAEMIKLVLDLQDEYGVREFGGTGEIPHDENDLEKNQQQMLDARVPFNNIQSDHRKGPLAEKLGICLYDKVPGFENMDRVTLRDLPEGLDDLEEYNINITDKCYGQQLVQLKHGCQLTQDPRLLDVTNKLGRFLGKGADAECFLSQDVGTNKLVVHKKFYGKPREREMDTLKALHHQNIPKVYGMAVEEDRDVLLMEFCGDTLRQWKKNRQMTEAEIWEIIEQLTDVLSFLESHGIIHRDIKPGNVCIQLTSRGLIIKLIDFGSVHITQDDMVPVCQGGRLTAAYMAPEMWLWCMFRRTPVSCKADMFACALTICFLVYEDDVVPQALHTIVEKQILTEMIRNPSQVADYVMRTFPLDKYSQTLKNILLKMLDGDPGTRISAADAHKQIVVHCNNALAAIPPVIETYDDDDGADDVCDDNYIKEILRIDIVNQSAPPTANQDASITTVPTSQPLILTHEQLLVIQRRRDERKLYKTVSVGPGVPIPNLENCGLDKDFQDINCACPVKEPDRQARPDILSKLTDRLKNGSRKRSCPVLPSEYTNLPHLDLIHAKKKQRREDRWH